MFERSIYSLVNDGVTELSSHPDFLREVIAGEGGDGWEPAELDAHVQLWVDPKTRPTVGHGFARLGGRFPSFNIVLLNENVDQQYLGQSSGLENLVEEAKALTARVEKALGKPVTTAIERWKVDLGIFVYAEHPEVCLACYNALRSMFIAGQARLIQDGIETPTYSGQELMPDARYMPENIFCRQWSVSGFGHVLTCKNLPLGPWALGRGERVAGVFVDSQVTLTGQTPGVHPRTAKEIQGDG